MHDPTFFVISATLCTALIIFTLTAMVRARLNPASVTHRENDETLTLPNRLSIYGPIDLLGIGLVVLFFGGLILHSLNSGPAPPIDESADYSESLLSSILFQLITAGIVTRFVANRLSPTRWLGLKWSSWPQIFLIVPISICFMWASIAGLENIGFMKWIESMGVESVQDTVKLLHESQNLQTIFLMSFSAVIVAPLCEEIVFRGYLFPAAQHFCGPWIAGIFSGMIFGAVHGNLAALLPLTIFGVILAFIYQKTGSIWAPIATHFCFNAATVTVQLLLR